MSFYDAMEAVSEGNKVRRASWPQEWWVGMEYLPMPVSECYVMLNGTKYYTISAEDLETEDWEIYG